MILKQSPDWVFPVAFGFAGEPEDNSLPSLHNLNVLKRNSKVEIDNDRPLPYIKEILDAASQIDCGKLGYINSDIMIGPEFYDTIQEDADAYIFSRSDVAEIGSNDFMAGIRNVIYGGDQHIGADGFFFDRQWWIENRDKFPDDLIIGETEWDTCYRQLIARYSDHYIEKRVLYHVYHDAKWTLTSPGAVNNIRILKEIG